jgi:hypothetical protein
VVNTEKTVDILLAIEDKLRIDNFDKVSFTDKLCLQHFLQAAALLIHNVSLSSLVEM